MKQIEIIVPDEAEPYLKQAKELIGYYTYEDMLFMSIAFGMQEFSPDVYRKLSNLKSYRKMSAEIVLRSTGPKNDPLWKAVQEDALKEFPELGKDRVL